MENEINSLTLFDEIEDEYIAVIATIKRKTFFDSFFFIKEDSQISPICELNFCFNWRVLNSLHQISTNWKLRGQIPMLRIDLIDEVRILNVANGTPRVKTEN